MATFKNASSTLIMLYVIGSTTLPFILPARSSFKTSSTNAIRLSSERAPASS